LFINDIAFIVETLRPMLAELGVDSELIGWSPSAGDYGRRHFLRNSMQIVTDSRASGDFEIIHLNYGLYAYLRLWFPRKPLILHLHGSDIRPSQTLKSRVSNLVSTRAAHYADQVWYSTPDLRHHVINFRHKARYMPSPLSDGFFDLPLRSRAKSVLFGIPLSVIKGAKLAVAAMNRLSLESPEILVSAFGFGPKTEESVRIRRAIVPSIRLIDWTPHDEMPKVFANYSVIVGQLGLGCLGLTELEAMASGRPLIANLSEPLVDSESYYRENPPVQACSSAAEVVTGVKRLFADPDLAFALGAQGREWARRYHSGRRVAMLYADAYRDLVEGGRRLRPSA
jgi:glycosyltransferase involved in cell wall biosynthesis